MTKLRLNVAVKIKDDNRDEFIKLAKELIEKSRQEEGCVKYDFYESLTEPGAVVIVETWQSTQALSLHEQQPHFKQILPQLLAKSTFIGKDTFELD